MTLYELQKSLKKRVERAMTRAAFPDLQVFIRNLPPLKYEGEADEHFPYCLVGLEDGEDEQGSSNITATLTVATMDTEPELRGYEEICHLIEILRLDLAETPLLDGGFEIQPPVHFTLGSLERETYPYFFGAVWFDVTIPAPQRGYNDLI